MLRHFIPALLLLTVFATASASAKSSGFDGDWRINLDETDKVTVRYEEGSGVKGLNMGKVNVSVMGLPLPSSAKSRSMSGLPAKDPAVLTCTEMNIQTDTDSVVLSYDDETDAEGNRVSGAKEVLRDGHYRGRTTSRSRQKIEQKYKTSERNVRKTWSIREDGRLLVAVRIKHKGDKARTYNRVFDKVDSANAQ